VTYLPRARAAGAHFRGHSTVTRVLFEKRRASGVEYVTHSGAVRTIAGQVVILAASAVQNPGILFHSRTSLFPQGPGNTGGALGRYFHTHLVLGAYGLFDDETENHRGVSLPILSEQEPAHPQAAGVAGAYRWGLAPALKPNDLLGIAATRPDLHGAALADFMRRSSRHLAVLSGLCATRVLEENRVELTAAPDHAGRARVRIHYRVDTATRELHARALQDGIRLLRAAGAREAWTGPAVTAHLLGGTIMGADPRDSVCDSYGRIHDVPNLFVAGGGLFPTCGSAAPTFTLHALALRSGEWILGNWSALAD
jgi:choline dehydrogenase-like flavoprotein